MKRHEKGFEAGFSIVELMVAMAIGLAMSSVLLSLLVSNKNNYVMSSQMIGIQDAGRTALSIISKDIRMTDHLGCRGTKINIDNNLDSSSVFDNFEQGLAGVEDDNLSNAVTNGTDTITIRGAFGRGLNLTIPQAPAASSDLVLPVGHGLLIGDIAIISDCSDGDIFQVSSTAGGTIVKHDVSATLSPNNRDNIFRKKYSTRAQVYRLGFVTYFISDGLNGSPALFRSVNEGAAQEIVENIENLQFLYGEDMDSNGTVDRYKDADDVSNMANVLSVQVTVVARTARPLNDGGNSYRILGQTIVPTDEFVRRVFSGTVVIRNRVN